MNLFASFIFIYIYSLDLRLYSNVMVVLGVVKVLSRKEGGTGLGLSIVEKLMELHDGKMFIESHG